MYFREGDDFVGIYLSADMYLLYLNGGCEVFVFGFFFRKYLKKK